ncbi:13137_t:CDS:2 [Ambispora gerdemannii]|uniref:13137_t:CDS:1 n=1 Tax=Ambispora gerdemannii TaxID=144530 RepID=A0A9N9FFB7_9GLOM|nr:13137_t:CDS:2 [Ambispora gerdemannii]
MTIKRHHITTACLQCREKKTRCSGKPSCQRCKKFDLECVFIAPTKNRGPPKILNNTTESSRIIRPYKVEKPFTTLPKINSLKSHQLNSGSNFFYSSILYINEKLMDDANNNNPIDCVQNRSCQKIESAFNNCRMNNNTKLDLPPLIKNHNTVFNYSSAPTYEAYEAQRRRSHVKLPSIKHLKSLTFNNHSETADSFMHPRPQTYADFRPNNPREFLCRYKKESSNVEFENHTQFEPLPNSNTCPPPFIHSFQKIPSPKLSSSSNILFAPLPIRPKPREVDQKWGLQRYF